MALPGWWVVLAGIASAGGAWVAYFRWKDKIRPEPRSMIALAVVGGALSVAAAVFGFHIAELAGSPVRWELLQGGIGPALSTALLIGAVEELAKLLPVAIIARFSSHFDEPLDGLVYAACAAIGFAMIEALGLHLSGELAPLELAARAVTSPITHALLSAPAGRGIAIWALERRRLPLAGGVALSITAHGAYDLFAARSGTQVLAAALILALWVWVIARASRWAAERGACQVRSR